MPGAVCAKIISDSYGSYGGAAAEAETLSESACEAMMQLYEDPKTTKEEQAAILAMSARECEWGDKIRAWNAELRTFIRTTAEKHI